ncbi:4Fe-4S dicluster domain-containing protein [Rhizobium sp. CG5]|uniref:4Fe-4S dicluster domain-containing protein n=1 Tax=Rhizobium sp. CG5 TaxID=2726076 RepID=UPI00203465D9|nr:4Fe-4S dicluster domain-containing protein [Rhizobium sp. CG5]MCM2474700.1 4Fe-4S dicluster domain-containing protein [Rhizobium sp. CG5]
MSGPFLMLQEVAQSLEPHGLSPRGVVNFEPGQGGPLLADGKPALTIVLIGHAGGSLWEPFRRWRELQPDGGGADPLDRWSVETIAPLAKHYDATAYFPSDQPYQPFQQWAMRAEGLKASPLGILIHPVYGLWHGYRGALGFAERLDGGSAHRQGPHPCATCVGKPCLTHCPVDAITSERFDVVSCRAHLAGDAGRAGCMMTGCLARSACPVGAAYRYPAGQLRFHMQALKAL